MWYLHLSTYALGVTVACAARKTRVAWSLVYPLLLLCISVVAWARSCTDPGKYAVLVLKCAVLALAWARCGAPRTGVAWALPALGVVALYVAAADVRALYGCAPTPAQYAGTAATALALDAVLRVGLRTRSAWRLGGPAAPARAG